MKKAGSKEAFVSSYKETHKLHERFTIDLHRLVEKLLEEEKIHYHLVEKRTKSVESFVEKIERKNKFYNDPVNDITDITGIRIIVYYNDDVEKVDGLLRKFFDVNVEKSIDAREMLNPNEFGYLSSHLIVKINHERGQMFDWKNYVDLSGEIQIRTVLQHSWSAISHALQYKSENAVPKELRRQLSRIFILSRAAPSPLCILSLK